MNCSNSNVYNLRTIFELRKTVPTQNRRTVARVFVHNNRPGLVDNSGALWPIDFLNQNSPQEEAVLLCEVSWSRTDGNDASKYEDDGFQLCVEAIHDCTPALTTWPNAIISAPGPVFTEQHDTIPNPAHNAALAIHTRYFHSTVSLRAKILNIRNRGLSKIRCFFENRGFVNMETPTLVPSGGVEAYVSSFHTTYTDVRGKSWRISMPTSPEFALKKLLAEGFQKVFQLSRAYRNSGELARWHEPEFMMLEWYRSGATLQDIMNDTRELVLALDASLGTNSVVPKNWKTHTVRELFLQHCSLDISQLQNEQDFRNAAQKISASIVSTDDWDSVFCKLFMEKIEPHLAAEKACFVTHYPRRMGALARVAKDSLYVERVEAYLQGVEICNGYFELTDTVELKDRFDTISQKRDANEVTRDLIFEETMKFGLPPCSGNALGVDRVIAIVSGIPEIAKLFPIPFVSQFPHNSVAPE